MTRQLSRSQALLLAVVALIGVSLATWVVLTVKERRGLGEGAFAVEANFADIGGVEVGTRVRLQGIDAGEVVAVVPPESPGAQVKLRLLLSGKLRHLVTADARVQIASENLFAGRFVRILPGSSAAGPVAEGALLASTPAAEMADAIAQIHSAVEDANKGKGTLGLLLKDEKTARDVVQTVARINSLFEGVEEGKGVLGVLLKDEKAASEMKQSLARINSMIDDVYQGKGSLGPILRDATLYNDIHTIVTDLGRLLASMRQNSDAIKAMPVVRSYVVDAHKELVRPECKRFCKWFPESDLFEPGKAVLTTEGRKRLDGAAAFLNEHKEPGSEVVIAGFASVNQNADVALTLTQKQSEAVCEYLKTSHHIQRMGWWWWSNRTVRCVGAGTNHPALPDEDKLPGSRIELLVFVPG
jgi:phospholipid/cholesterol/gamma-HCH transport system substrate-binding protein